MKITEKPFPNTSGVSKISYLDRCPLGDAHRGLTKMNIEFVSRKRQAYQLNYSYLAPALLHKYCCKQPAGNTHGEAAWRVSAMGP